MYSPSYFKGVAGVYTYEDPKYFIFPGSGSNAVEKVMLLTLPKTFFSRFSAFSAIAPVSFFPFEELGSGDFCSSILAHQPELTICPIYRLPQQFLIGRESH